MIKHQKYDHETKIRVASTVVNGYVEKTDAIIERDDSSRAAFKFKMSEGKVKQAIAGLKRVRDKVVSAYKAQ